MENTNKLNKDIKINDDEGVKTNINLNKELQDLEKNNKEE